MLSSRLNLRKQKIWKEYGFDCDNFIVQGLIETIIIVQKWFVNFATF